MSSQSNPTKNSTDLQNEHRSAIGPTVKMRILIIVLITQACTCKNRGNNQSKNLENIAALQSSTVEFSTKKKFPHSTDSFTQGLQFYEGRLFESVGRYGRSKIMEVQVTDGTSIRSHSLESRYFAEGMTIREGKAFQLTWKSEQGFIYDIETFDVLDTFRYDGQGWGLTHTDEYFIKSNGTSELELWGFSLDPITKRFPLLDKIAIVDEKNQPLNFMNELEYVNGKLLANIWLKPKIAIIDLQERRVTGWIDLTSLVPESVKSDTESVLNGIAFDGESLFVTGKHWPFLYELTIPSGSSSALE